MMVHTNEMERAIEEGTSYLECFKGIDRRRTEISMLVFFMQLGSGQNLIVSRTEVKRMGRDEWEGIGRCWTGG